MSANAKLTLLKRPSREPKSQNIETWCQFSGWCPELRGLAGALSWGIGDPFRKICTGSKTIGLTPPQLDMEWQPHLGAQTD